MREPFPNTIDRARHGTDARRVRGNDRAALESLAAESIRLARIASALHLSEAARLLANEPAQPEMDYLSTGEHAR